MLFANLNYNSILRLRISLIVFLSPARIMNNIVIEIYAGYTLRNEFTAVGIFYKFQRNWILRILIQIFDFNGSTLQAKTS